MSDTRRNPRRRVGGGPVVLVSHRATARVGIGNLGYGSWPRESTLEVIATLDELRTKVPPELFEMVERAARQPTVEELDI
jgi:EXLDI family protein